MGGGGAGRFMKQFINALIILALCQQLHLFSFGFCLWSLKFCTFSQVQIAGYAEFPEAEDWEKYTSTDPLSIDKRVNIISELIKSKK